MERLAHENPKRFWGETCARHPELLGERYIRHKRCVGCNRDNVGVARDRRLDDAREKQADARDRIKRDCFDAYGGCRCSLCPVDHPDALCLDHTDGGGGEMRKNKDHPWGGNALYRWLRDRGYPPGFRVLCFNCNAIQSVASFVRHGEPGPNALTLQRNTARIAPRP